MPYRCDRLDPVATGRYRYGRFNVTASLSFAGTASY